jgi:hypothetical protein
MSFANINFSSDLNAFRSDGVVYETSITFSGTLTGSGSQTQTSSGITISNLDFYQVLFDNSQKSAGKFRDISMDNATFVRETTGSTDLVAQLRVNVVGDVLTVTGVLINAYSNNRAIQSTTVNIRVVTYDSTLL